MIRTLLAALAAFALYAMPAAAQTAYGSGASVSIGRTPQQPNCTGGDCVVTVANTYYLVAPQTNRDGCTIQNTSASAAITVQVTGIDGLTAHFPVTAGNSFSCSVGPVVLGNRLDVTSATAGSTYTAMLY